LGVAGRAVCRHSGVVRLSACALLSISPLILNRQTAV
jgi:hypothetical protein